MKYVRTTLAAIDDFDSQAFTSALSHKNGLQFATLYTLQHRLSRNAELHCCFQHRQILRRRLRHNARPQVIVHSNLPGCPRSNLFAGDETIRQPAVNTGSVHAKDLRCLADADQFSVARFGWCLVSRDVPVTTQTANLVGGEALTRGGLSTLAIQNTRDNFVGIQNSKPAQKRNRIFVGAGALWPEARNYDVECGDRTSAPAEGKVRMSLGALQIQNHLFQKCAQQLFAITIRCGRRIPDLMEIGAQRLKAPQLVRADRAGV
jgi:hypothetical protein